MEEEWNKFLEKPKKREKKRRKKMKISGKSVFKVWDVIKKKGLDR